ncbi:MAG: carbohydrate porin [Deltaproteobacteria bacterium]|nr:carbohydrate porin [Deltaproteobacteria bacterium]
MADGAILRRTGAAIVLASLLALVTPVDAADDPPEGPLEQQNLTGGWQGVRPALSAHGFEPYLTYIGLLWGNLNGGAKTGVEVNGYLDTGFEQNFHKLGLWKGFGFHFDVHWFVGEEPTVKLIGGTPSMALSGWEASDAFRVYNIYLRQAFADGRYVVKLGQLAADTDFMVSRYAGMFLNAAFGDLPSQNLNSDAPVYPLAAPGVFLRAKPLPWLTGRFGAYTGDPGIDTAGNHGFDWKIGNNAGYIFFAEAAAEAPQDWLPATYTLGGIYDTGGRDPVIDGFSRGSTGEIYLMVDQALLASDGGDPLLAGFARISGSMPSSRSAVGIYADAGLAWCAIPSRPKDMLGLAVSFLRYTSQYEQQTAAQNMAVGDGETVLELTYQFAVAPWLVIQPDAQFFFNPSVSRRDAQAIGGEMVVVF